MRDFIYPKGRTSGYTVAERERYQTAGAGCPRDGGCPSGPSRAVPSSAVGCLLGRSSNHELGEGLRLCIEIVELIGVTEATASDGVCTFDIICMRWFSVGAGPAEK
jgi:hypothetical protein